MLYQKILSIIAWYSAKYRSQLMLYPGILHFHLPFYSVLNVKIVILISCMASLGLHLLELSWFSRYFPYILSLFGVPIVGFFNNQIFCANITWFFNLLQIFTLSPKKSTNFQLMLRFTQGVTALGLIAALALVVVFTDLSVPDLFACILAFIPTGWTIISVSDFFMTFFGCWPLSSIFWIYTTIRGCCGLTKSECPSEWFCYKSDGIIFQILLSHAIF